MELNQIISPQWDSEDIKLAEQFQRELDNPNSVLNHYLQWIQLYREDVIRRISAARKEADSLIKLSGELKSVGAILNKPQVIVQSLKDYFEKQKSEKDNESILEGQNA